MYICWPQKSSSIVLFIFRTYWSFITLSLYQKKFTVKPSFLRSLLGGHIPFNLRQYGHISHKDPLLPPANEVCEGYVFTDVCLSAGREVSAPLHVGIHTPYPPDQTLPWVVDTPLGSRPPHSACWEIRATNGRYASYWNAFLCLLFFWMVTSFYGQTTTALVERDGVFTVSDTDSYTNSSSDSYNMQKGYPGTDTNGNSDGKLQWKLVKFNLIGTDISVPIWLQHPSSSGIGTCIVIGLGPLYTLLKITIKPNSIGMGVVIGIGQCKHTMKRNGKCHWVDQSTLIKNMVNSYWSNKTNFRFRLTVNRCCPLFMHTGWTWKRGSAAYAIVSPFLAIQLINVS